MQEGENSPEPSQKPKQEGSGGIAAYKVIFIFIRRSHYPVLLTALLSAIISGFPKPLISILTGRFLNTFAKYSVGILDEDQVRHNTAATIYALAIVGVGSWVVKALFTATWVAYGESQARAVREDLFSTLLVRHLGWFEAQEAGISTLLSRIQTQILDFQSGTGLALGNVIVLGVQSGASLGVALYYNWKLTLVVLGSLPLIAGGLSQLSKGYREALERQQAELTRATKQLLHSIQNLVLLKCYNTQSREVARYMRIIESSDRCFCQQIRISASQATFMRVAADSMLVITLGFGTYLVHEASANSGSIMTAFWSATTCARGFTDILTQLLMLEKGRIAARALHLLFLEVEQGTLLLEDRRGKAPMKLEGDIEFIDVSFSYPSRPDHKILRGVHFFFPAHETTFVIGKSGSGKSSLAALLLRFYAINDGRVELDGIDIKKLDTWWLRNNITLVQQTNHLFTGSIYENIAICSDEAAKPSPQVLQQCLEFAYLQEVVEALPDGIDTEVGKGGTSLSGGQRQRLALARARLRDTPVLLLDESTSALDHTSKIKVMHNIRQWRRGKTTIIITHDMSQIRAGDFMYVLKDGELISEGYRHDVVQQLQASGNGDMIGRPLTPVQSVSELPYRQRTRYPGSLRPALDRIYSSSSIESTDDGTIRSTASSTSQTLLLAERNKRYTINPAEIARKWMGSNGKLRPTKMVADLSDDQNTTTSASNNYEAHKLDLIRLGTSTYQRKALPSAIRATGFDDPNRLTMSQRLHDRIVLTPLASRYSVAPSLSLRPLYEGPDLPSSDPKQPIAIWTDEEDKSDHETNNSTQHSDVAIVSSQPYKPSFKRVMYTICPALSKQQKRSLTIALCAAVSYGAIPSLSSWLMAHLFQNFQQRVGWQKDAIKWSLVLVALSLVEGGLAFTAQLLLQTNGQSWVRALRIRAIELLLKQPKSWYDSGDFSQSDICTTLDKAAEDVRDLLGKFTAAILIGAFTVVVAVSWSMTICWRLTIVSLSSAPVIYAVTKVLDTVSHNWQARSVKAAGGVADVFAESFADVRTVRALTLESHFHRKFMASTSSAFRIGLQRGFYIGLSFGASDSIMPLMTAAVFAYSIKLATSHQATTASVTTALVMMIFCLTSASGVLSTVPQIASSLEAASRVLKLNHLPAISHEQDGQLAISHQDFVGQIAFRRMSFVYPTRSDARVLRGLQLHIAQGSFTALVGKSGCGKSTIISLILRLYECANRTDMRTPYITVSGHDIRKLDIENMRSHITYMPQQAVLFPMSIKDNILYGSADTQTYAEHDLRTAAQAAGIHEFVMSLPNGYDTLIGEGGLSVSGGQAQRIALARGFARRSKIMLLDEPTSALDEESARTVRQSLLSLLAKPVSLRPTIIVITHSKEMMEIAENVVMLKNGAVAEQGPFKELMSRQADLYHMMQVEEE